MPKATKLRKIRSPKKTRPKLPDGITVIQTKVSRSKIDLQQALKLRIDNGLSFQEIADYFGVKKQSIHSLLRPYLPDGGNVKTFREHKADILAAQQMRVLSALSDSDLKKASAKDKALIFGILHDKESDLKGSGNRQVAIFFQIQQRACEVGSDRVIEVESRPMVTTLDTTEDDDA